MMTDPHLDEPPPTPPPGKVPVPGWLWAVGGALAVIVLGLLIGGGILLARDDGSTSSASSATPTSTKSSTMIVSGMFTLTSADVSSGGGGCWGTNGYDDIGPGTQVVIRNSSGQTVGVGTLDSGVLSNDVVCAYKFSVQGVPRGLGIYSVEVSHRGQISFPETEAQALALKLS